MWTDLESWPSLFQGSLLKVCPKLVTIWTIFHGLTVHIIKKTVTKQTCTLKVRRPSRRTWGCTWREDTPGAGAAAHPPRSFLSRRYSSLPETASLRTSVSPTYTHLQRRILEITIYFSNKFRYFSAIFWDESKMFVNLHQHVLSTSPFLGPFKNGFNAALRCCLHITLNRSKVPLTKMMKLTVRFKGPYRSPQIFESRCPTNTYQTSTHQKQWWNVESL